jgi:hypothetical protein
MTQVSLARLTVIAALLFMALRPAHAEIDLATSLARTIPAGATLVCGDLKLTNVNGKLHSEGPNGARAIEFKGDDLYIGGHRCVLMKCPKEAQERQC